MNAPDPVGKSQTHPTGGADADATLPLIRVFDGVGVVSEDGPIELKGARQRRLLALLVIRSGSVADVDWLAEYLWDDTERPDAATPAVRTAIHRLRAAFPERARDWLETTPEGGYRLAAPEEVIEHLRFAALRAQATSARHAGDYEAALALLDEALRLWRGDPFRELEDLEWAFADIERLRMDHLEMQEERWEAALALGRHTQVTGELAAFSSHHADRDRSTRQYALALHRSGRTAEALKVIAAHKRVLVDEYGLDPSPAIDELEGAMLRGDLSLELEVDPRPLRGYRLLLEIGVGAFSVVWRAEQPSVDREVAVKQIRSELANHPDFIRRFEAEAHLIARIEHPHVVPLIDYWRDPDSAYLVMRLMRGGTLEQRLQDGPLSLAETLAVAGQVGGGLSAAHGLGVVHRDVKPGNILYDEADNAYLGDFGIAVRVAAATETEVGRSRGSPAYAAPEQLRGETVGPTADVYSLAAVLLECLSGSPPSSATPSPRDMLAKAGVEAPEAVVVAITRATALDPADRYPGIEAFLEALGGDGPVTRTGEVVAATVTTIGPAANPYLGLRAFDDADAGWFFGREQLVRELVARIEDAETARCLVVVGPSGSGKSSVVRAGLVPALRDGAIAGSADWFVTMMVPGGDPYEALEAALLRIAVNPPPSLIEQLRADERGMLRAIRRCLPGERDTLVLVVDQFEELFTGRFESDDDFLTALTIAVTDPDSPLRLIGTLRADFYDRPLEHPDFAPVLGPATVTVTPLAGDELERAIVEPARRVGVAYEPGVAARVAAELAGQPSPLPLLQYALAELFDRRTTDVINAADLDALGGLSGTIAARAEGIYADADEAERLAIRRILGSLVDPAAATQDVRRRAPVSAIGTDVASRRALEQLGDARLVTFDRDVATREPTVEVAHEALLREWPRLVDWLSEDRELLRETEALQAAADGWDAGGRVEEDLIRGVRLERAEGLVTHERDRLRPMDLEFVRASRADADAGAALERQRRRRQRLLAGGIGIAAVVAIATVGFAAFQQSQADAEVQAAAADRARLAALVERVFDQPDPRAGLELALEARREAPGPDTEAVLLGALQRAQVEPATSAVAPGRDASDAASGRRYEIAAGGTSLRLGTAEGPWETELRLDGRSWISGSDGFAGERLLLESQGSVRLVDSVTGRPIGGQIRGLAADPIVLLSPDGRHFAVVRSGAGDEGSSDVVDLYDASDASVLQSLAVPGEVVVIRFDPVAEELLIGTAARDLISVGLVIDS